MGKILSALNPLNWFKAAAANAAEQKVDELVTVDKGNELARGGVNYLIGLSGGKVADDKLRRIADGLVLGGTALTHLGEAIHPDGEDGRRLSEAEASRLYADIEKAFGNIFDEERLAEWRADLKNIIRAKLGVK